MNDQNVVCTHELTVRFEQFEDGSLQYYILPGQSVLDTDHASLVSLAEQDAPLSIRCPPLTARKRGGNGPESISSGFFAFSRFENSTP